MLLKVQIFLTHLSGSTPLFGMENMHYMSSISYFLLSAILFFVWFKICRKTTKIVGTPALHLLSRFVVVNILPHFLYRSLFLYRYILPYVNICIYLCVYTYIFLNNFKVNRRHPVPALLSTPHIITSEFSILKRYHWFSDII